MRAASSSVPTAVLSGAFGSAIFEGEGSLGVLADVGSLEIPRSLDVLLDIVDIAVLVGWMNYFLSLMVSARVPHGYNRYKRKLLAHGE